MEQCKFTITSKREIYPFIKSLSRISKESKIPIPEEKLIDILSKLSSNGDNDYWLWYLENNLVFSIVAFGSKNKDVPSEIVLRGGVTIPSETDGDLLAVVEKCIKYNYGMEVEHYWKIRCDVNGHKALVRMINSGYPIKGDVIQINEFHANDFHSQFAVEGYNDQDQLMLRLARGNCPLESATNLSVYNDEYGWFVDDMVFSFNLPESSFIEFGDRKLEFDIIDHLSVGNPFKPNENEYDTSSSEE